MPIVVRLSFFLTVPSGREMFGTGMETERDLDLASSLFFTKVS